MAAVHARGFRRDRRAVSESIAYYRCPPVFISQDGIGGSRRGHGEQHNAAEANPETGLDSMVRIDPTARSAVDFDCFNFRC